jgi:hypothetical protein
MAGFSPEPSLDGWLRDTALTADRMGTLAGPRLSVHHG